MTTPRHHGQLVRNVLLVIIAMKTVTSFDGCSVKFGRRGCSHRVVHGVTVVCNGNNVESTVPKNIPLDTVHLTLVGFNLTRLSKVDLERFVSVQCLTLSDSRTLSDIDQDAFSTLSSLVELTLDATNINESQLSFITHESFSNMELLAVTRTERLTHVTGHGATRQLHALRTLDLRYCAIEHISPLLYHELRRLEKLDLTGNRLTSLNWTQIGNYVTHLNSLLLSGNRIQTLPTVAQGVLFAVKELTLGDNPLHCNCQLGWLRDFYHRSAVDKTLDNVYCASPTPHGINDVTQGQNDVMNFKCVEPETPVIMWSERGPDRRVEMNCTSRGDPSPSLWLRLADERILISPPSDTMSDRLTITPQLLVHVGFVICRATNSEGSSQTMTWVGPFDSDNGLSTGCHTLSTKMTLHLMAVLTFVTAIVNIMYRVGCPYNYV